MNTFSKPKKLLVCMLAAAMGASALAGGMLLNANAEPVDLQVKSEDLFTASEGVTVSPASQYEKSDGTPVGDTGLRFQSQNDEAFTIELNGIFHRSFGLDWSAPADGWLSGNTADTLAEVVFEIAEYGNPDNKFEIHYAGYWNNSAWVEYDYTNEEGETETLYRTYGLAYQGKSRMVYSKEIIDNAIANPDGSDLMFSPVLTANGNVTDRRFSRTELRVQNSLTDGTAGSTATDGSIINVVGWSNGGGTVPIASFRDEPETFTPTDAEMEVYTEQCWWDPSSNANYEIGHNLPRINFDNGYTVKIHVSAGLEFMAFSIGEIMDNDYNNYWTNEPFNTWPAMQVDTTGAQAYCNDESNASTYWNSVSFYQKWKTAPFITIPEYDSVVAAGTAIKPPAATYATNGNPEGTTPVSTVEYRVNGVGDWEPVSSGTIPAQTAGSEVEVRYSVPYNDSTIMETIQLTVRNIPTDAFSTEKVLRTDNTLTPNTNAVSNGGSTTSSEKGLLVKAGEEVSYSFDFVGRFTGNTEIGWGMAAENGWNTNGNVTFTIAEAGNPENCFQVVWASFPGGGQSVAYVKYKYGDQTLYCAQGRNNNGEYLYELGNGTNTENKYITDNWDVQYQPWIGVASSSGILGLEWNGDVLNVMATNEEDNKQILASFVNDTTNFQPVTEGTGGTSNLPKISFENGYTVSVDVNGPIDFMLYGVTTAEDTTSFAAETLSYEPVWYTLGARMPVFDDLAQLPGVQNDEEGENQIAVPEITYTTAAKDAVLKIEWIKPDGTPTTVNAKQQLTLSDKGDHILRYTVTVDGVDYTRELVVHACDYATFVEGSGTPATCSATGNGDYSCEHDFTINKEIPINPNAHSYGEPTWTWTEFTGATAKFTCTDCFDEKTETASITNEVTKEATCTEAGERTYTATVIFGGKTYTNTNETTETIPATDHSGTMQHVDAKEAGCTEDGNVEYWYCSACKGYFKDEQGSEATTLEEVTIPATGAHSYGEPTWTWTGVTKATAEFTCSACGDVQTVNATVTNKVTKEATCETAGERTYTATATFGGKTYTAAKTEAIAATGHHMVQVPAKAPTCTEDGNSAYYKCSECGRCSSDDKGEMEIDESTMILKATGHSYEEGICTVCGAEDPDYAPETGLTGGEIAGITIACVAVAGGGVALAVVLIRKKKLTK